MNMNIFAPAVDHSAQHASLLLLLSDAEKLASALSKPNLATINFVPPQPEQPLLIAAAAGNHAESVSLLLAAKADVDVTDGVTGATACFAAAQADATAVLSVLILANADINKPRGSSGATPLYMACQSGHVSTVRQLLAANARLDQPKQGGFTPLHIACMRQRVECVSVLLEARADADAAYGVADRFTPLMLAAHFDHAELVQLLLGAGASMRLRDAQGRTARDVALAEGHGRVASLLGARAQAESREGVMLAQEATVQELRQMRPVQAELEIDAARLDALHVQIASFGSQQAIFEAASQLQSSASVIAHALLPARRLAEEIAGLDTDAGELEAQLASAARTLTACQAAVSTSPTDATAVSQRDAARGRHAELLEALRQSYERRRAHGHRYASAVASAAAAASVGAQSSAEEKAAEEEAAQAEEEAAQAAEAAEAALPRALSVALPVLNTVLRDVGEANRATLQAMEALSAAMARELALMDSVRVPLAEARRVCDGAIRRGARSMLGDVPASDLAQLELLLAQLGTRQRMREHSQALLLEAQRSLKGAETASEAELELCDRLDEIKLAMARAQRHHDDGELARLRTEAAELHEALASVRSQAEHARRVLADPLLLEEYPEMRRHVRERAQAGGGSGGGFEGGGFEGGGFEGSVFGIAGLGAYGDGGSGVVGVGSLVDSMLRFAAFELLTEASRHQPGGSCGGRRHRRAVRCS